MKKKIFSLIFAIITVLTVNGQNLKLGISLNYINDFDWDKPLADFLNTEKNFSLKSKIPLKFGICIQKDFKIISPSLQINVIYRNIKYSENHIPISDFNHYSLNVPLNLNFKKNVSDESSFIANIGGGINYILTPSNKTKIGMNSNDSLIYSLHILKPDKPTAFFNCGIGWECTFKNIGVFQIKVEYMYEFSKQIKYMYIDKFSTNSSNNYRINYLSYGLTYLFPINKQ